MSPSVERRYVLFVYLDIFCLFTPQSIYLPHSCEKMWCVPAMFAPQRTDIINSDERGDGGDISGGARELSHQRGVIKALRGPLPAPFILFPRLDEKRQT